MWLDIWHNKRPVERSRSRRSESCQHNKKPADNPPVSFCLRDLRYCCCCCVWSGLSSRRFSVGRSSSLVLVPLPLLSLVEVRRRLGRLPSFSSRTLCRFSIVASRAFTSSNSEVVTMYCAFAGRMVAISFCDAAMRSGVCGCDAKPWRCARLLLLFRLNLFEEADKRLRIIPVLYIYCRPR